MTSWQPPQSPPAEWGVEDLEALLNYHGGWTILFDKDGNPRNDFWRLPVPRTMVEVCTFLWGDVGQTLARPPEMIVMCDRLDIGYKSYWCLTAYGQLLGDPIRRKDC